MGAQENQTDVTAGDSVVELFRRYSELCREVLGLKGLIAEAHALALQGGLPDYRRYFDAIGIRCGAIEVEMFEIKAKAEAYKEFIELPAGPAQ